MNDKHIGDEQLDALLAKIEVPADLKESLLQISERTAAPDEPSVEMLVNVSQSTSDRQRYISRYLAVAAVVVGLVGTLMWINPFSNKEFEQAKTKSIIDPSTTITRPSQPATPSANSMEAIDKSRQELNAMLAEVELRKLKSRLNDLERSTVHATIDLNEFESLVAVYSGQSISTFGGDAELVRQAMNDVKRTHPNTRGAEIATQFLSQQESQ